MNAVYLYLRITEGLLEQSIRDNRQSIWNIPFKITFPTVLHFNRLEQEGIFDLNIRKIEDIEAELVKFDHTMDPHVTYYFSL